MFAENYNNLENTIISSTTGKIVFTNDNSRLIPINTKSNKEVFKDGSFRIIGELSRILCNKQISLNIDNLNFINDDIMVDEESDEAYYLNKLFEDYLSKDNLHPKLLLQIPLSDNDEMRRSEKSIAKFLYDLVFKNLEGIDDFFVFDSNFQSNFIISHIMKTLDETDYKTTVRDQFLSPNSMEKVLNIIKEDFQFALGKQKFLLDNFERMVSYYLFFYFCQFLIKTSTTTCSSNIEETYYLLDWESASEDRKSNTQGYSRVSKFYDILKIKMDVIEHLNLLLGKKNMLVPEIKVYYENMGTDNQMQFKHYLSLWIKKLRQLENLEEMVLSDDITGLIKDLEDSIADAYEVNKKSRSGPVNRYKQIIPVLANKYFVKLRGKYGYMFNMDLELLLLITQICIGNNEEISFNHLMEEYKKRGLFFDDESRSEILHEFEKLNLIDKKSDSEEVQYVRLFL